MKTILLLSLFILVSTTSHAREIWFENVVGNEISQMVAEKLTNEMENVELVESPVRNLQVIARKTNDVFYVLSMYFNNNVVQTGGKYTGHIIRIYFRVDGRECVMFVNP